MNGEAAAEKSKNQFREILRVVRFRLLQQYPPKSRPGQATRLGLFRANMYGPAALYKTDFRERRT